MTNEDGYWKKIIEGDGFLGGVLEDAIIAYRNQQGSDSQFARRTLVRSMFSAVEGVTHIFKRAAIQAASENGNRYSFAELGALREESFSVTRQGEARPAAKFVPLFDNFMFAVNMLTRGVSRSYSLEEHFRSDGIRAFQSAVRVRNRIVHPRRIEDINISDDELAEVTTAFDWFIMAILCCMITVDMKEALRRVVSLTEDEAAGTGLDRASMS